MKDLTSIELIQIVTYYKNKTSDLELEVVKKQLEINKLQESKSELNGTLGLIQAEYNKVSQELSIIQSEQVKKSKAKSKA